MIYCLARKLKKIRFVLFHRKTTWTVLQKCALNLNVSLYFNASLSKNTFIRRCSECKI